jgi:DNA-binding NarL/FixJ family response regulator
MKRPLTEQEKRIAILICQGKSNRSIGKELELQENTVKQYISTMLKKLGLENRVQLAMYMVDERDVAESGGGPAT